MRHPLKMSNLSLFSFKIALSHFPDLNGCLDWIARLFVDSTFCNSCGSPFKGVENMAKGLGLEKVDVYIRLPNGHLISGQITP
jgi:hypothetical protein